MKKKTFCRKIKVLSYLAAFIIMVGANIAMDKMSTNKHSSVEAKQNISVYPYGTDSSVSAAHSKLFDSVYADRPEAILLFR